MESLSIEPGSLVVLVNGTLAGLTIVLVGRWLAHGELSVEQPSKRQNAGETLLRFFVGKARDMDHGPDQASIVRMVAPLLACFFLFIFVSNLMGTAPVPVLNRPPTSHFSVTLALALCSVFGTLTVSGMLRGTGHTVKHLFWPNPMQWVSEITDVMSLSLRLFGNIAGEFMTLTLVVGIVPYGIPLILHALGLIPAFVQALVFTLLTSSFIANAIHREKKREKKRAKRIVTEADTNAAPLQTAQ